MDSRDNHIIKKISAELRVSPSFQNDISTEAFRQRVEQAVQELDEPLRELSGNAVCQIESLSIELNLPQKAWPKFEEKLKKTLIEKITEHLPAESEPKSSEFSTTESEKNSPEEQREKLVHYFLKTGRLLWWSDANAFAEIETWLGKATEADWAEVIQPAVKEDAAALNRLSAQFPEKTISKLLKRCFPDLEKSLKLISEISAFLKTRDLPCGSRQKIIQSFYKKLIESAADNKDLNPPREISVLFYKFLKEKSQLGTGSEWFQNIKDSDLDKWEKMSAEVAQTAEILKPLPLDDQQEFTADAEFYISNAGVVLLHPFMESLFKNLALLKEKAGDFVDNDKRERAVCLLHYLAAGAQEFPDPELSLAKFLCNWPLEWPVDRFLTVSNYEKEECETLISSAVGHWEALKNTSPEGLRANFLQRDGILRKEAFGWSLYIEQKTQDILLEKLPWNLSVVKFSWMEEMLTIQWR